MSGRFTSLSGSKASRKRQRHFTSEREQLRHKLKSTKEEKKRTIQATNKTNHAFLKQPHSGGTNNVMTCSSIEMLAARLNEARKFTLRSVFVDFGCSAGSLCLYIAQRYRCSCIGIEKEVEPVRLAIDVAASSGLSKQCTFIEADFNDEAQFAQGWLERVQATHVFAYDKVFSKGSWDKLFATIAAAPAGLVGANCAVKRGCHLPESLVKIGEPTKRALLCGGKSGYALQLWQVVH